MCARARVRRATTRIRRRAVREQAAVPRPAAPRRSMSPRGPSEDVGARGGRRTPTAVPRMAFGREGRSTSRAASRDEGGRNATCARLSAAATAAVSRAAARLPKATPAPLDDWRARGPRARAAGRQVEPRSFCSQPVDSPSARRSTRATGRASLDRRSPHRSSSTTARRRGRAARGVCGRSTSTASATPSRQAHRRRPRDSPVGGAVALDAREATRRRARDAADAASSPSSRRRSCERGVCRVAAAVAPRAVRACRPLAPLSRGIQKKRASQASEPIHTVFQEKKAQQKRPTRAAGRRSGERGPPRTRARSSK